MTLSYTIFVPVWNYISWNCSSMRQLTRYDIKDKYKLIMAAMGQYDTVVGYLTDDVIYPTEWHISNNSELNWSFHPWETMCEQPIYILLSFGFIWLQNFKFRSIRNHLDVNSRACDLANALTIVRNPFNNVWKTRKKVQLVMYHCRCSTKIQMSLIMNGMLGIFSDVQSLMSRALGYYVRHCNNSDGTCTRSWTHNRQHISRPHGRTMGCMLWVFWSKLTSL